MWENPFGVSRILCYTLKKCISIADFDILVSNFSHLVENNVQISHYLLMYK